MTDNQLKQLRNQINDIDDEILKLLAIRSETVINIGKNKNSNLEVVDLDREQKILKRLLNNNQGSYSKDTIVRIWRELFEASTILQIPNKLNIQTKRSINDISIYKGGQSSVNGNQDIIKLSSNENTYGPSPRILKSLNFENLDQRLNRYPEINGITLRNAIAKINNLDPERIVLGCGSDEILLFAALAFCRSGDEIIQAQNGFEMYSIIAKIVGATTKFAQEINYAISIDSIIKQINESTKLIYIANPNNPTGTYLNHSEIRNLMKLIPKNIVVVLDGAYAEYVLQKDYDKGFALTDEFKNIILTRTFSKSYGLAGLRIGWCYSSFDIVSILNKVKGPFNTSFIAQEVAIAALEDQEYIEEIVSKNYKIKSWFEDQLMQLGINVRKTFANFTFIEETNNKVELITQGLLEDGIIVRKLDSYNLPNCLRITIGTQEEMNKTLESLKKVI